MAIPHRIKILCILANDFMKMEKKKKLPKSIKAIIFDIDGVLIDSNDLWYELCKGLYRKIGGGYLPKRVFLPNAGDIYSLLRLSRSNLSMAEYNRIRYAHFDRNYFRHFRLIRKMPGTGALLRALSSRGFELAAATNTPKKYSEETLRRMGLLGYFSAVAYADEVRHFKPNPDMLLLAMRRLGVGKGEVVYVGDTRTDREAAKRAGIYFIGLKTAGDRMVRKLESLLKMLKIVAQKAAPKFRMPRR
jgi:HAD superfamily hydrolase (TIGR01509 family)